MPISMVNWALQTLSPFEELYAATEEACGPSEVNGLIRRAEL